MKHSSFKIPIHIYMKSLSSLTILSVWTLVAILTTSSHQAFAHNNPEGFSAPVGHKLHNSKKMDFGRINDNDRYKCANNSRVCSSKDGAFDEKGMLNVEGKIQTAQYKRLDEKKIEGLLLQRNYQRVIQQMNGRLVGEMDGHSVDRGWMKQVFLIEQGLNKKWILVDTNSDSFSLNISVLTVAGAPEILSAAALKNEIDSKGFATLHLNFESNKSIIRQEDKPALDQVVSLLKLDNSLKLSIEGHTDNIGDAESS
jgi:OOP family OmpA-OmpF porin